MSSWHRRVSIGTPEAASKAILEVNSTTKGSIPAPRMTTTQRDAIASPDNSLTIFNTTEDQFQYYSTNEGEWRGIGAGGVGYQESLGNGNGITASFTLTLIPSSGESILVWTGGSLAEINTDWTYNVIGNSVDFISAPAPGLNIYVFYLTEGQSIVVPTPSGTQFVEYIPLDSTDITNKYIVLFDTPSTPINVMLDWCGQTAQIYSLDFSVTSNQLGWNGLGLDGVITAGQTLRIFYFN